MPEGNAMHIQVVPANSPVLPWVKHGNRIMQADPIRKAVCERDAAKFCPQGMEYGMRESDAWIEWYAPLNEPKE